MEILKYKQKDFASISEKMQSARIMSIIQTWANKRDEPFLGFYSNIEYFHAGVGEVWNSSRWKGEIDLIAVMRHHFLIIEMKSKKATIKGRTQKGQWEVKYDDTSEFRIEKDYFTQCSQMKTFFSQRYYPDYFINSELSRKDSKLVPDVLLIFKEGSDLSNVWFTPPIKFEKDEFIEMLSRLSEEDQEYLKNNYYYNELRNRFIVTNSQNDDFLHKLEIILAKIEYENRVAKWFRVLNENDLEITLDKCGSEKFEFCVDDLNIIATHFKTSFQEKLLIL